MGGCRGVLSTVENSTCVVQKMQLCNFFGLPFSIYHSEQTVWQDFYKLPRRQSSVSTKMVWDEQRVLSLCLKSLKINFGTLTQVLHQRVLSGCQKHIFTIAKNLQRSARQAGFLHCYLSSADFWETFKRERKPNFVDYKSNVKSMGKVLRSGITSLRVCAVLLFHWLNLFFYNGQEL